MTRLQIIKDALIVISVIVMGIQVSHAQEASSKTGFLAFGATYGIDFPAADLSERYGSNFHAAVSIDIWNPKLRGFWGIEGELHFGDKVKENILASATTSEGTILGSNGQVADIFLRRRGSYIGIYANRNFISFGSDKSTGLNIGLGLGIMQHNIRIQDDTDNAAQFKGDYLKGYDRNTRGPALKQTIGIQKAGGKNANMNYSIGLSITEGFTKQLRSVNFDTGVVNEGSRLDVLIALEATWYLPLRRFTESEEIFY